MAIDEKVRALLEGKNFLMVGTIRKDGWPQVVPVWVDTDGEHILVNSAEGRGWPNNLERDPRVTCTIVNWENPYEYAQIYGRVVEQTTEGADELIDKLAFKYLGEEKYPFRKPDEQRITIRIAPERIRHQG